MRIIVFGASGRVGRLVVEELLRRGHEVTAFTHSKAALPKSNELKVVKGDINSVEDITKAIGGGEAVISALGSWGTANKDILTVGMKNIIPAMQRANIKRIISLTGSDARINGDKFSPTRPILKLIAPKILADGEQHIKLLQASNLDWTVVRSPRMTNRGTGYKLTRQQPMPWTSVSRQAVANCMADLVENNDYVRRAPHIVGFKN